MDAKDEAVGDAPVADRVVPVAVVKDAKVVADVLASRGAVGGVGRHRMAFPQKAAAAAVVTDHPQVHAEAAARVSRRRRRRPRRTRRAVRPR